MKPCKVGVDPNTISVLKNSEKSQLCDHVNCNKVAEHRAPKSRENLREYYWFCLEHVREYNKSWNYFEDMSEEQLGAAA